MEPSVDSPVPKLKRRRRWVYVVLAASTLLTAYFWWQNQQLKKDVSTESQVVAVVKSATQSVTPTPSQKQTTSVVTGSVGYPSSVAPAQTVCAVSTTSAAKTCIDYPGSVAAGSLTYSIIINPGTYNVYASLKAPQGDFSTSYKAYYNKFVACSISGNCAAGLHGQNIAVVVGPGVTVGGIDPTDWYALGISQ